MNYFFRECFSSAGFVGPDDFVEVVGSQKTQEAWKRAQVSAAEEGYGSGQKKMSEG